MYAIKEAELLKEHVHGIEASIFYMDVRAFGKGFEEFYRRAEEEFGIKFVKGRVAEIVEDPTTKNLLVRAEDIGSEEPVEKEADMVVLSAGLVPPEGGVSKIIPLIKGEDGFFAAVHPKVDPVTTAVKGVYVAGVAEGPKDIPDAVTQASAAAMKASIVLGVKP